MLLFIFPFVTLNLLISLGILTVALIRILSTSKSRVFPVKIFTFGMRADLILALYFFLIAVIVLLLTPTYLLAVFELEKICRNRTCENGALRL